MSLHFFIIIITAIGLLLFLREIVSKRIKTKSVPGERAQAIILGLQVKGSCANNQRQVIIQVQVFPETGRNFVTELQEAIEPAQLFQIKPGSSIWIYYDKLNPKRARFVGILM